MPRNSGRPPATTGAAAPPSEPVAPIETADDLQVLRGQEPAAPPEPGASGAAPALTSGATGQGPAGGAPLADEQGTANEPVLPPDAILDDLYDAATGEALYEIEDPNTGERVPCDLEGNPIPASRPGLSGAPAPAPAAPTVPPAPDQPTPPAPREFRPPLGQSVLTEPEQAARRQAYEEGDIDAQIAWADLVAQRTADATIVAREQQRHAARQVGIPDELVEMGAQYQAHVPAELRGTPRGAMTAAGMAILTEAMDSGDFMKTLQKYAALGQAPPPVRPAAPPPPPILPPSAREVVPNATGLEITRTTIRRQAGNGAADSIVNRLLRSQGVEGDAGALFIKERQG